MAQGAGEEFGTQRQRSNGFQLQIVSMFGHNVAAELVRNSNIQQL